MWTWSSCPAASRAPPTRREQDCHRHLRFLYQGREKGRRYLRRPQRPCQPRPAGGKNATAHAGFQDKLAGAIVHDEEVVVDGNITTSYGLGGAIPFALELVRQLAGPAEADRIQKAIAYRH